MMKPSMFLVLVLASCAHETVETQKAEARLEELKPAIREQIVPGTTYGNVVLQAKTVYAVEAVLAARSDHVHCTPAQTNVSDTWAPNKPTPSEFNRKLLRWTELWTLDVCGDSLDFEVSYTHHTAGIINISVSQQEPDQAFALD